MTERTEEIRYLTDEVGVSEELARLQLRDEDLWVLIPEQRFAWEPGDEDVAQWQQAYEFVYALTIPALTTRRRGSSTRPR